MMAMTTSSSIKVNARRGFMPDKTPPMEIRFNLFSLLNTMSARRQNRTNYFDRITFQCAKSAAENSGFKTMFSCVLGKAKLAGEPAGGLAGSPVGDHARLVVYRGRSIGPDRERFEVCDLLVMIPLHDALDDSCLIMNVGLAVDNQVRQRQIPEVPAAMTGIAKRHKHLAGFGVRLDAGQPVISRGITTRQPPDVLVGGDRRPDKRGGRAIVLLAQ